MAVILYLVPLLGDPSNLTRWQALILGIFLSTGTYVAVSKTIWKVFTRSITLRKIFLGKSFVEGTWIGHYVRDEQQWFTIEHYTQEDDELKVEGFELDPQGKTNNRWNSTATSIDQKTHTVRFSYELDPLNDRGNTDGVGLAVFRLVFSSKRKHAKEMDGYSVDLVDNVKDQNRQYKISDGIVDRLPALEEAKRIFKKT